MLKLAGWTALCALLAAGCVVEQGAPGGPGSPFGARECVDRDGDGFGVGCAQGPDCDDRDGSATTGCLRCATPADGCPCEEGARPQACSVEPTFDQAGAKICHEGTRYCREGAWSGCESIVSYPLAQLSSHALVDPDAGPERCSDCAVNCFIIRDNLDPVDGGLAMDNSQGIGWAPGGGLTLGELPDAGLPPPVVDAGTFDPSKCMLGVAPDIDCDGIPDEFDPYPDQKPFDTANPAIFLDIGPGEVGTGVIDLSFFINSADVYFLLDQTNSMTQERDQLKADLVSGNFISDPTFNCADTDFDFLPNNELKSQGLIGAIRCIIRDTSFGTGFYRELPFSGYGPSGRLEEYVAFENYQDITQSIPDVIAAVAKLDTDGNNDWEEAAGPALYNLVTGSGMYFGTRLRGIPPRVDCPGTAWGYPCFRDGAIPIVILFTDAQMHNGPSNNDYPYNLSSLGVKRGTQAQYYPLSNVNEDFTTAADLGDLTNDLYTFTGDTTFMGADLSDSLFSCLNDPAGLDATFKFSLSQQRNVTISSEGSRFDTVLALFTGAPAAAEPLASSNTNETGASAQALGNMYSRYVTLAGNTSGMAPDLESAAVGCDAARTAPDAVYSFSLSQPTRLAIDTLGSSYDTVIGLHALAPVLAPTYSLATDTNDDFASADVLGDVYDQVLAIEGSTASLSNTFSEAQVGCGADNAARDGVFEFDVSSPTRVRISTEGSGFDTVLALFDNAASAVGMASVAPTNETQASAYALGTLDDKIFQLDGSTSSMNADYVAGVVGCNANSGARDAVFSFSLATTRDVQIDTAGSAFDTVLGLYDSAFDPAVSTPTTNDNDTQATALNLGTLNGQQIVVTGGNTNSMSDDYDKNFVGCSYHNTAPEAAFRFHLDTSTEVKLETVGSSFDTVLSLFQEAPSPTSRVVPNQLNEVEASAYDVGVIDDGLFTVTGNSAGMNGDYDVGCSAGASSPDAVLKFTVNSGANFEFTTEGSGFDTVLGLYPDTIVATDPPTPAQVNVGASNNTQANARDMGVINSGWFRYRGDTSTTGTNWNDLRCSADSGAEDAFFRFTVNGSRRIRIDTSGSSYDTVISLYRITGGTSTSYVTCDHSNSGDEVIDETLSAGNYLLVVKGDKSYDEGAYEIDFRDMDGIVSQNLIECDDDDLGSGVSRISRYLSAGTYHLVVKRDSTGSGGAYTVNIEDTDWSSGLGGRVTCNDDGPGVGSASTIQQVLGPGDYWFLVTGYYYYEKGPFALKVSDLTNPPGIGSAVACSDDVVGTTSRITMNGLAPGDYYVMLKGDADSDRGNYTLNVKDLAATASGAVVACDADSGPDASSVIERDLDPGTYQVILKGDAPADQGAYALSIRDVTNRGYSVLACDADSGGGNASYLERDLAAGDYFVTVKGDQPAGQGAYSLSLRDVTQVPLGSTQCNDNGGSENTSVINTTLNPGTYYLGLKGKTASQFGRYQLSVGGSAVSNGSYVPPTWSQTLQALNDRDVRVMSILSCQDDLAHGNIQGDCNSLRSQATALANATDTLGSSLQPLVYDIDSDGSGLSKTVIDGVSSLANYLEMDVQVIVKFEPDANPGFNVTIKAIDEPGDGCDGLVGQEHQRCVPGATPKFTVQFENPASSPVPLNPAEPMFGGYNFKAQLIGNGQFIVDEIPIYIIPDNVIKDPDPPKPPIYESGTYWQDVSSPGCGGPGSNLRPDWHDLSWVADVYTNTTVTFSACGGDTPEELDTCTPNQIASVTGGGPCATTADCPMGWCSQGTGACQIATADTCSGNADCPVNAQCLAGTCVFDSQPVYVGGVLGAGNRKASLRMSIALGITNPYPEAPVVHAWQLTYLCDSAE